VRERDTVLARRAAELLAQGPADSIAIVAHACSLPSPPLPVAERLAAAMFAGRPEFVRGDDGRWRIVESGAAEPPVRTGIDALNTLSFAVVDVETTGSQPAFGDRITEVAITVVRDGQVTDSFETLVNPQRPIPAYISRLTNITWEMVCDAPTFGEVAPKVVATMSGHVFTAHNATFDWKFISAELGRAAGYQLDGRRLCTVRLARRLLPQLPRRSLDHLARYYGVVIEGRHRAGGDALATARCLLRMLGDARDRGCETWDDLERLGRKPRKKRPRRAPASPTSARDDTSA
jgi:DNA polymerase III subunit epsilon